MMFEAKGTMKSKNVFNGSVDNSINFTIIVSTIIEMASEKRLSFNSKYFGLCSSPLNPELENVMRPNITFPFSPEFTNTEGRFTIESN